MKLKPYTFYRFRPTEQDPIIDAMKTAFEDTGDSYSQASKRSGIGESTMASWFKGKTRRPQFATVAAFCMSQGKHGIVFGNNGPRLIGRAVPDEHRAHTGSKRKRKAA